MSARVTIALAWAPAVLYMGLIWALSSTQLASVSLAGVPFGDKGVHFAEYGMLGFLVAHAAFRTWPRHHPVRVAALGLLITVLWAFLDEVHQAFVPGRSSEALDLLADGAGAAAGVGARTLLRYAASLVVPRTAER